MYCVYSCGNQNKLGKLLLMIQNFDVVEIIQVAYYEKPRKVRGSVSIKSLRQRTEKPRLLLLLFLFTLSLL